MFSRGHFCLLWLCCLSSVSADFQYPYEIEFATSLARYRQAVGRGEPGLKLIKRQVVEGQFRVLNGPTWDEWHTAGGPVPDCGHQLLAFLRGPGNFAKFQTEYAGNAERGQGAFASWFAHWQAGAQLTLGDWKSNLRTRHLLVTGVATGTPHWGPLREYRSDCEDEVHPGKFRNEVNCTIKRGDTAIDVFGHVQAWLEVNGEAPPVIPGYVEIRGMKELLRKNERQLILPTFSPKLNQGEINYPAADDLDLFFELGWARLQEVNATTRAGVDILDALSDYYHTVINAQFFFKVENSVHFPEVNVLMRANGKRNLAHGVLDLVAKRMNYLPFRQYFRRYVEIYQIP